MSQSLCIIYVKHVYADPFSFPAIFHSELLTVSHFSKINNSEFKTGLDISPAIHLSPLKIPKAYN